ncbi:Light-sensor Protein kinase [Apostasia shenzhenica]|uniref:Light-sensor Protein kinase n=1 Tax=Apostasia shenzhenica TaxID=1088818 RepID=A0A2I0BFW1_9ASPA|nr:Light-sensor Protein kinase [Apostasia shenzhenica]
MEQFRHVGEVLGSIRALMVFRDDIRINPRQCFLLVDAMEAAFMAVSDEIRQHLRIEEKNTKWKTLENPLKELHRIFRDGEQYIRQCLEPKDWWGRTLALSRSADCLELHLHNLLWCIPVVIEAIEMAGDISGEDLEATQRKRSVFSKKYDREWMEPSLFQHKFGKLYLASTDLCRKMSTAAKEDRWILSETIAELRSSTASKPLSKQENRLAELLTSATAKILPSSTLVGSPDYQVRRRLNYGSNLKEIQWMGESFALKHVFSDPQQLMPEISLLSSISHPNIMNYMYLFSDDDKKESFMVMELTSKDLSSYIKEVCCTKRRVTFQLPAAVDIMLQIARGMEYLHSHKIYHGELNPSNIFVKTRTASPEGSGYVTVKVAGLERRCSANNTRTPVNSEAGGNLWIWYAPEVLSDQEQTEAADGRKFSEKADVYSFAMICFQLLTGKTPFEDIHLQGEKMSRNIKSGERPLFPISLPKYLINLIKRCWQSDPNQRPNFSSICRVLRYIKRFLIMNLDQNAETELPSTPLDYFEVELYFFRKFENWQRREGVQVSGIPFEMYAFRVIERERTSINIKEKSSDSSSDVSINAEEKGFQAQIEEDSLSTSVTSSSSSSARSTFATLTSNATTSNGHSKTTVRKVEAKKLLSNKQIGNRQKKRTEILCSR